MKKLATNNQKIKRETGELKNPLKIRLEEDTENKNKTNTAKSRPTTPPSLLGIERKIA
jgi:hypothetical protein